MDLPALREEMASMREELSRAWAIVDGEPKRLAEARQQGAAEERARTDAYRHLYERVVEERDGEALLAETLAKALDAVMDKVFAMDMRGAVPIGNEALVAYRAARAAEATGQG